MKNIWGKLGKGVLYAGALVGLAFVAVFVLHRLGITNQKSAADSPVLQQDEVESIPWQQTEEWQTLEAATLRDKEDINKAGTEMDVSPRYIMALLTVEQMRLFFSNRDLYKDAFAPLQLLGNQTQFSLGVMGIKEQTAEDIEKYLYDSKSAFFSDVKYQPVISKSKTDDEIFARLTDEKTRLYSYRYAALMSREIGSAWKKAGYPIDTDVGVLATLYNIGFQNSHPNKNPQVGGAIIEISGREYTFGEFAKVVYESEVLIKEFPRTEKVIY